MKEKIDNHKFLKWIIATKALRHEGKMEYWDIGSWLLVLGVFGLVSSWFIVIEDKYEKLQS